MRWLLVALWIFGLAACERPEPQGSLAETPAKIALPEARPSVIEDRFALLALSCIHRSYPNKIAHVLASDSDALPPRKLTPAFYGCYDWHSSVHGHWLLARILNTDPETPMRSAIETALAQSFTAHNIAGEVAYYTVEGRKSFERPYGIAWFLQLATELEEGDNAQMASWRETLRPLELAIVARIKEWLPDLHYPIRTGTHNETAFAFGLMLDYARATGDEELAAMITEKATAFYVRDEDCPLSYEPSGEDFLSPCLMEADLMRRILPKQEFSGWLTAFLPSIPTESEEDWLEPGIVTDPTDGKLAHLYGVNLSRAWALEGIAQALPADDPRRASLIASAGIHRKAGVAAVSDEHYEGSHWLGSFAVYLTTRRGIADENMPE